MPERFLIRTEGGPHPDTYVTDDDHPMSWPLPDFLADEGGWYAKVAESSLPPQEPGSRVMRGATYEWRPGEAVTRG